MKRSRSAGFTLIESVTVIALAGVAFMSIGIVQRTSSDAFATNAQLAALEWKAKEALQQITGSLRAASRDTVTPMPGPRG